MGSWALFYEKADSFKKRVEKNIISYIWEIECTIFWLTLCLFLSALMGGSQYFGLRMQRVPRRWCHRSSFIHDSCSENGAILIYCCTRDVFSNSTYVRSSSRLRVVQEFQEQSQFAKMLSIIDEIQQNQAVRYFSASEPAWRLSSFRIVEHRNSVDRLELHLESPHTVYFESGCEQQAALKGHEKSAKLMAWVEACAYIQNPRHIRNHNFPRLIRWNKKGRR